MLSATAAYARPNGESAGVPRRGPLSKQRNAFLQTALIEAAHLAIVYNQKLHTIYETECQRGPKNRATLAVARRLVRWLLAIDRRTAPRSARQPA